MPATPAQVAANRLNGARSKGPTTAEGKERSRANAFKHGLTGEGVVLPNEDAAEVERRFAAYRDELQPSGEVGRSLALRAAVLSVRMERCVSQETAALSGRVRQAEADFVAPEGADAATVAQLKAEAMARAMFDPSHEAVLARKYEAAAERGFFRALKELRLMERQAKAAEPAFDLMAYRAELGSFLSGMSDAEFDAISADFEAKEARAGALPPSRGASMPRFADPGGSFDLPFSIGRPR